MNYKIKSFNPTSDIEIKETGKLVCKICNKEVESGIFNIMNHLSNCKQYKEITELNDELWDAYFERFFKTKKNE